MGENEQGQCGLLRVRCGVDTDCNPDLPRMRREDADELLTNWFCGGCLDERDAAEAAGFADANIERFRAAPAVLSGTKLAAEMRAAHNN